MIRHIPNAFTLLNLFSGSIGVFACANGDYKIVPVCIIFSLVADFLDGLAARILKVKSEIGAQLDSLADMISFGLLPGIMLVQLFSMSNMPGYGSYSVNPVAYLGLVFTVFACIRLAKFNIDTRQTDSFLGLATPAATTFVLGLYLFFFAQDYSMLPTFTQKLIFQTPTLILITGVLSYLMISEIPMFGMKGKLFQWKGNEMKFLLLFISIPTFIFFREIGLCLIVIYYIIVSVVDHNVQKVKSSESISA